MRATRFLVAKFMGSAMHALAVTLENKKSSNELHGKIRRILLKTRTCCHSKMIAPPNCSAPPASADRASSGTTTNT
jgi:hypothetical protein